MRHLALLMEIVHVLGDELHDLDSREQRPLEILLGYAALLQKLHNQSKFLLAHFNDVLHLDQPFDFGLPEPVDLLDDIFEVTPAHFVDFDSDGIVIEGVA